MEPIADGPQARGHPRKQPDPPSGEPAPPPPAPPPAWPNLAQPPTQPPGTAEPTPPMTDQAELAGALWQIAAALQQTLNQLVDLCAQLTPNG